MRRFQVSSFALVVLLLVVVVALAEEEIKATPESTARTELGQIAPDFEVARLDGTTFQLVEQRGRIVLINFFATWCPPCKAEMPHLEEKVWGRFADEGLVMISISREETIEVVVAFREKHALTFPFAADTDRSVFKLYADAFIPRNYVIGRDGRILFQSQGFEEEEFAVMIEVIAESLARVD